MRLMSGKIECQKHHLFYDPAKTGGICPECAAEASRSGQGIESYGATEPAYASAGGPSATEPAPGGGGYEGYQPTEPSGSIPGAGSFQSFGKTEPAYGAGFGMGGGSDMNVGFGMGGGMGAGLMSSTGQMPDVQNFDLDPTMPADNGSGFTEPLFPTIQSYGPTVPAPTDGIRGFAPVVGWLVCIDGPNRGKDYRIHPENNFVGRLPSNDICIEGDERISRERHVMVVYDSQDRVFYLGAPGGMNIVRLNGKPVLEAKELHPYDVITIGSTKLMFMSFCGERFGWDE